MYKDFTTVIRERWQREMVESVFDVVNEEHDVLEKKKGLTPKLDEPNSNCEFLVCHILSCIRRD